MKWVRPLLADAELADWQMRARESILDLNDGIVMAAGLAEGFASAGATTNTLFIAGLAMILAGGFTAAGVRYGEVRTEWEVDRAAVAAERASIQRDPEGEFEELVGIYEAKGLDPPLARQVARALTDRDPVAAHADAELQLASLGATSGAGRAAVVAGSLFALGAVLPLVSMLWIPVEERIELTFVVVLLALSLTGWFASWLTGLPALRLIVRNVAVGSAGMLAGLAVGLIVHI